MSGQVFHEEALSRTARRRGGAGGGSVWLVTFIDLISLLLAFFVMMYSMSSMSLPAWQAFTASLNKAEIEKPAKTRTLPPTPIAADADRPGRGVDVRYLRRILESGMARETTLALAVLRQRGGKLVLSLPGDLFFAPGGASVLVSGSAALFALAETLSNLDNRIDVIGHTDPRPTPAGGRFTSNWGLSWRARPRSPTASRGPVTASP
ncbi:MAG: flagellar motor protein MotB [Alphaproteobacteria bacterium]|nr:flagellar motor protein MotB [Alphaproteobacteria bacterium]